MIQDGHASIKAVKTTFSAIMNTLEELSDGSDSRAIEARGLLFQIKKFQFLLSLLLFERIFSITAKLSDLLQAEHLNCCCCMYQSYKGDHSKFAL